MRIFVIAKGERETPQKTNKFINLQIYKIMATKFFEMSHKIKRTADFTTMTKDFRMSQIQEEMQKYMDNPSDENRERVSNLMALNKLIIDGKRPLAYDENRKRIKYDDDIEVTFTAVVPYEKLTAAEKLAVCEDYIRRNEK